MRRVPGIMRYEKWRLYLLVVVAFLLGLILLLIGTLAIGDAGWNWAGLVNALGIAFISAALLALLVEAYLRESLYSEIGNQISSNLQIHRRESIDAIHFQRLLMPEISELVRRTIIEEPFIERDMKVHCAMEIVQSDNGPSLRAEVTSSSVCENVTDEPRNLRYEEFMAADYEFIEITAEGVEGDFPSGFHLTGDNIKMYLSYKRGHVFFSREIPFPPRSKARITSKGIGLYNIDDWESFICIRPTVNMEITVSVPPRRFKFSGEPEHPLETYFSGSIDNERGQHRWSISGALMPYQGISLEWEPWEEDTA